MKTLEKPNTKRTPFGVGLHFGITSNIHVRRNGKRIKTLKNQRNLILDTGMADIGQRSLSNFQDYCHWGDDATSNTLDSGAITASQSGTTVTASAGIFSAGDVGALLKFDSGEEHYITTFNSSTEVVVDTSATVASSEFTIWYVDQTTLVAEQQRTNSTQGTNNWSQSAGVLTRTRTHIFPAVGSSFTVREVGWGHENTTTVGSRVVLGSPISLISGDQLEVESFFEVIQSPTTPTATDPTTDEGSYAGNFQVEAMGIGSLDASGDAMEPGASESTKQITLSSSSAALGTYPVSPTNFTGVGSGPSNGTTASSNPSSPPWRKTFSKTFGTGFMNGSARSVVFGNTLGSNACRNNLRLLMTSNQSKDATQTLSVVVSMTWDRNLTN